MLGKYGSEEAVRAAMREFRSRTGESGFSKMTPERIKEISKLGVAAREKAKDNHPTQT